MLRTGFFHRTAIWRGVAIGLSRALQDARGCAVCVHMCAMLSFFQSMENADNGNSNNRQQQRDCQQECQQQRQPTTTPKTCSPIILQRRDHNRDLTSNKTIPRHTDGTHRHNCPAHLRQRTVLENHVPQRPCGVLREVRRPVHLKGQLQPHLKATRVAQGEADVHAVLYYDWHGGRKQHMFSGRSHASTRTLRYMTRTLDWFDCAQVSLSRNTAGLFANENKNQVTYGAKCRAWVEQRSAKAAEAVEQKPCVCVC